MRKLIQQITPPILMVICKRIMNHNNYIFEGIFQSLKEIKNTTNRYTNEQYERATSKNFFNSLLTKNPIVAGRHSIVPIILSQNPKIKVILDVGGGNNPIYRDILQCTKNKIFFYIAEYSRLIDLIKKTQKLQKIQNLRLIKTEQIKKIKKNIDIAFFGSSIQYIDNWEIIIETLSKKNCRMIIFADSVFTDYHKHFLTLQKNVRNANFPCILFSKLKFISYLENQGYKAIYNEVSMENEGNLHKEIPKEKISIRTIIFEKAKQ